MFSDFFRKIKCFQILTFFWQSIKYWIFWVLKVNIFVGSKYYTNLFQLPTCVFCKVCRIELWSNFQSFCWIFGHLKFRVWSNLWVFIRDVRLVVPRCNCVVVQQFSIYFIVVFQKCIGFIFICILSLYFRKKQAENQ